MKRLLFTAIFSLIGLTSCTGENKKDSLVNLIDTSGNIIAEFNDLRTCFFSMLIHE